MRWRFHPEALREAEDAATYLSDRSIWMGERFAEAVEVGIQAILKRPDSYPVIADGVRVFRLKRFPYHLYYVLSVDRKDIVIYAVAHTKRRSGYWQERLPE